MTFYAKSANAYKMNIFIYNKIKITINRVKIKKKKWHVICVN